MKEVESNGSTSFAFLFDKSDQLVTVFALFCPQFIIFSGIAKCDYKSDSTVYSADLTDLGVIKPTEDAGPEACGGSFCGDISRKDADIDRSFPLTFAPNAAVATYGISEITIITGAFVANLFIPIP